MKNKLNAIGTLLLLLTLKIGFGQTLQKVKLTINYTLAYCGGAKPSEEIITNLNKEKLLANCKVMLVHENNMALKGNIFTTNEKGELEGDFKDGVYKIFVSNNKKNKSVLPFNKNCKTLLKLSLGTFSTKDGATQKTVIRFPCDPCDGKVKKRP